MHRERPGHPGQATTPARRALERPLRIGVPRESRARETRVAATPATVTQLVALGYDVVVETGAGEGSSFPDDAYTAAGARVAPAEDAWAAEVVLKVNAPSAAEIARLRRARR